MAANPPPPPPSCCSFGEKINKKSRDTSRPTFVCMHVYSVITQSRVWINRVSLPILLVVSWTGKMTISVRARGLCLARRVRRPVPRKPAYYSPHYRKESGGRERSFTLAQQQTGQVRLPGVTGNTNTPAPTTVNNDSSAALVSASMNVVGGQGTLTSSSHAMLLLPATLFRKARISLRNM